MGKITGVLTRATWGFASARRAASGLIALVLLFWSSAGFADTLIVGLPEVSTITKSTVASIPVTLSAPASSSVSVSYATYDMSDKAGVDYVAASGTLTFAPGETSKSILITTLNNTARVSGTFGIQLSNSSGPMIGSNGSGLFALSVITITGGPSVSISPPSSINADRSSTASVTVTLSGAPTNTVSVTYATQNDTATSGKDFSATSGTLTFAPGETSKTISVSILYNTAQANTSDFSIVFSSPTTGVTLTGTATYVTIAAATPILAVPQTLSVSRSSTASISVTLTGATASTTVNYGTQDGTAIAGKDYAAASGSLTFAPGETSKTISVAILNNTAQTNATTFTVSITKDPNAPAATTISNATTIVTIGAATAPTVTVSVPTSATAGRSSNVSITASLSSASTSSVTVGYATQNGTAVSGMDYTSAQGTLIFNSGETSKTITVPILNNSAQQNTASFTLALSNPSSGLTLGNATTQVTIAGVGPVLTVPTTLAASRSSSAILTVTLSSGGSNTITVAYSTQDGTAHASTDYTSTSGSLSFAPGETTKTISVPILNNAAQTGATNFSVTLANPSNGVALGNATTTVTIAATTALRVGAVLSTAQTTSLSFLRFYNAGSTAGTATVTVSDYATGQSLGQWTSPNIQPGAAQQYGVSDLEKAIGITGTKPQYYSLLIQSQFQGTFQHVVWQPTAGVLTNLSTCSGIPGSNLTTLTNVHTSNVASAGYPSSIVINNTGANAEIVTLTISDPNNGNQLGTYTTASIPANGQAVVLTTAMESAARVTPAANQSYYNISAKSPFAGYLQHLINNQQVNVITDMSPVCSLSGS